MWTMSMRIARRPVPPAQRSSPNLRCTTTATSTGPTAATAPSIRKSTCGGSASACAAARPRRLPLDCAQVSGAQPTVLKDRFMEFVLPAPPVPVVPVQGGNAGFAVRRIYCVGRNYVEHAKEMGHTGREPPFFFMKPGDAILAVPERDVGKLPYPELTADFHFEVELVAAIGTGGHNIPAERALEHVWGYAVGLDMTRRDLQSEMKKLSRPWCIGKAFEASAPIGPITPAAQVPHIHQAAIALSVNGTSRTTGHITEMIWNVA